MASELPNLSVQSLNHEAFAVLREAILDGRLAQGERINEVQVSRSLGISRGPLREALRRLEQDGLVNSSPNRGVSVVQVTARDALDLLNVRRLMEPYAVLEALRQHPDELQDSARAALTEMGRAARAGNRAREAEAHSAYHGLFYNRSGNTTLDRLWNRIEDPVRLYLQLRQSSPEGMLEVASAHQRLVDLLAEGNASAIRSEVLAHLDVGIRSLKSVVASRTKRIRLDSQTGHGQPATHLAAEDFI
jgi:DNA-binding GntR family transcriptional regulator